MNRRELITRLAKGTALLAPALPMLSVAMETKQQGATCSAAPAGRGAHYFPNVPVINQDGERAVFYRDLIQGKVVVINFTSIKFNEEYPTMQNLAGLQDLLGDHLGKDVFMYTITFDPDLDSAKALKGFAARYNVKPGWSLLTGRSADIQSIRDRFFTTIDGKTHQGMSTHCHDCARGIVRIGNEALGRWTAVPSRSRPEVMAHYFQFMGLKEPLKHFAHKA